MKFSFAFSALVALAATAASAAPNTPAAPNAPAAPHAAAAANSTLSARADCIPITLAYWRKSHTPGQENPVSDTHQFELTVLNRYSLILPFKTTTSTEKKGWRETRKSPDGLWKVNHAGDQQRYVILTAKKKEYRWEKFNYGNVLSNDLRRWDYWQCIDWY
ncbi:hypothetical protein EC991_003314 [Linnemannia zychae]|nr:hypothetical protein EC991_003314 [Linnemannia zychae]